MATLYGLKDINYQYLLHWFLINGDIEQVKKINAVNVQVVLYCYLNNMILLYCRVSGSSQSC